MSQSTPEIEEDGNGMEILAVLIQRSRARCGSPTISTEVRHECARLDSLRAREQVSDSRMGPGIRNVRDGNYNGGDRQKGRDDAHWVNPQAEDSFLHGCIRDRRTRN